MATATSLDIIAATSPANFMAASASHVQAPSVLLDAVVALGTLLCVKGGPEIRLQLLPLGSIHAAFSSRVRKIVGEAELNRTLSAGHAQGVHTALNKLGALWAFFEVRIGCLSFQSTELLQIISVQDYRKRMLGHKFGAARCRTVE